MRGGEGKSEEKGKEAGVVMYRWKGKKKDDTILMAWWFHQDGEGGLIIEIDGYVGIYVLLDPITFGKAGN